MRPLTYPVREGRSMRELKKRIEMLEEACKQLDKNTHTGDRLALILVDNLAEITMYDKVRYLFSRDSQFRNVRPRKYSDNLRKNVLRVFPKRLICLCKMMTHYQRTKVIF